jgi:ATP-dependent RNA helicase DHX34
LEKNNLDLLCFVGLLETAKPYLINSIKVPALPSALLFAQKLDISPDSLHILVDEWLELEFKDRDSALKALEFGAVLRYQWIRVVNDKLRVL